jgi:hypothetical protein
MKRTIGDSNSWGRQTSNEGFVAGPSVIPTLLPWSDAILAAARTHKFTSMRQFADRYEPPTGIIDYYDNWFCLAVQQESLPLRIESVDCGRGL